MMPKDKLYDAAFRYKKAGIWKKLWDNEVFAIKLTCGEIGYMSIMGKSRYPPCTPLQTSWLLL